MDVATFSLDSYVVDFVKNNAITLYILLTGLKGMALMTKSTKDDKIVTLLSNMFGAVRGFSKTGQKPDTLPEVPEETEKDKG